MVFHRKSHLQKQTTVWLSGRLLQNGGIGRDGCLGAEMLGIIQPKKKLIARNGTPKHCPRHGKGEDGYMLACIDPGPLPH